MKITDKILRIDATPMSWVYFIQGQENVLIDTCMPFARGGLLRELESAAGGLSGIRHILLTHHDLDHIGNAALLQKLTGATVWASAEDIPYITGEKQRHSFKKYLSRVFRAKPPEDLRPFVPGEKIGGVEVIPTPGHTPGHVCFLYDGVLFAGDLLENKKHGLIPYPVAWDWDYSELLKSVKAVGQHSFRLICPSHGKPAEREQAEPLFEA